MKIQEIKRVALPYGVENRETYFRHIHNSNLTSPTLEGNNGKIVLNAEGEFFFDSPKGSLIAVKQLGGTVLDFRFLVDRTGKSATKEAKFIKDQGEIKKAIAGDIFNQGRSFYVNVKTSAGKVQVFKAEKGDSSELPQPLRGLVESAYKEIIKLYPKYLAEKLEEQKSQIRSQASKQANKTRRILKEI